MNVRECLIVLLILCFHWMLLLFSCRTRQQEQVVEPCLSAEVLVARELLATTGIFILFYFYKKKTLIENNTDESTSEHLYAVKTKTRPPFVLFLELPRDLVGYFVPKYIHEHGTVDGTMTALVFDVVRGRKTGTSS